MSEQTGKDVNIHFQYSEDGYEETSPKEDVPEGFNPDMMKEFMEMLKGQSGLFENDDDLEGGDDFDLESEYDEDSSDDSEDESDDFDEVPF